MKILCTLLAFFFLYRTDSSSIDLGIPPIQAVCKVTLKNGKTIEGFVVFAQGGYEHKYRYNGFCYTNGNRNPQLKLYDFHFRLSNLNNSSSNSSISSLHYVENISDRNSYPFVEKFDKETQVITKTYTDIQKYKLLDHMPLYTSIPLALYLGDDEGKLLIDVSTLRSVELVIEPSVQALQIIENARKKQQQSDAEEYWVDYNPPVWYHEILKNKEKYNYLSEYF